ncbi:helix-turn-helix domain-containing protein [Streptomyces sp. NPDC020883]|uniref:helix-turn-helix domain-containing protein n=1 Tax=unclassified Streptomyces TaxID=2593676 RepID=UPI0021B0A009|nr:helix-turn-helix domain-containing protein [Streptomyces sp. BHT-5-2]
MTEFQESGFSIVGDHLAQHPELSMTAIGLGVHILSLPEGSPVDIRTLAEKFPEGRERIASGLRELEKHGYLQRVKKRLPDGRLVTVTYAYNNPKVTRARQAKRSGDARERAPAPAGVRTQCPVRPKAPASALITAPTTRAAKAKPRPFLPRPRSAQHHTTATALLANLRRDDARLLLPVREIDRLAPGVAAWLERGVPPEAVRRALSADLPDPVRNPAGLVAHRLTALLPPPLPETPPPPEPTTPGPAPFQTCDGCERAFRAREAGLCRECREGGQRLDPPPDGGVA